MKKRALVTVFGILILFNIKAQVPSWEWARIGGGVGKDAGGSMVIDSKRNVYVLGGFRDNNATIGTSILINSGDDDIFLLKYNPNGNLIWARSIGNVGTDSGSKLIIDKNDGIYVSGIYNSPSLTIGSVTLSNSSTSPGNSDFFIAKYNSNGQVLWAKGSSNSNFNAGIVAIDDDLNTYSISRNGFNTVLEKFDATDNLVWFTNIIGVNSMNVSDLHADASGVYLTGSFFGGTLTIGSVTLVNSTVANQGDMFVARMDTSGNVIWAKNAMNTSSDWGRSIEVDNMGNSYVLGSFAAGIIFDSFSLTTNGDIDLFLVKYDLLGQVIWAKSAGGSVNDWVNDLTLDDNGGAYVIGNTFSPTFAFANTSFSNLNNTLSFSEVFILKYDNLGNEEWLETVQNQADDEGNGITVSNIGEVYVTGGIQDFPGATVSVGGFSFNHIDQGDFFLAKLSSTVGFDEKEKINNVSVYPNPTNTVINVNYESRNNSDVIFTVFDLTGRIVKTKKINSQSQGKHSFSVNLEKCREGTKLEVKTTMVKLLK